MYQIKLTKVADKFYQQAEPSLVKKLNKCFDYLKVNPYKHNNIKILTGPLKSFYRYRIGKYRVVYMIDESSRKVIVSVIDKREDVYKG